jgi:hypothetical protein
MLGRRDAFEILDSVIGRVAVPVVDVTAVWDRPESNAPNVSMQLLATSRPIPIARPTTIETAIEILRDRVKDDWILEPFDRLSADLHPLSVLNK